jgi:Spy/CpxP family protein refolding chaperone
MMKWIIVLVMLISLSAYGDDDHHFPMDLHDLGLTKQQHRIVEEAMKEYQYSNRRYHQQKEKSQEELNALFLNPSFDVEAFRTKNLEMEKASIDIRARLFERLHAIFTPEQKRRFTNHLEEWDSE